MKKIALISVSDKQGIVEFATTLQEKFKYEILAPKETASVLKNVGLQVTEINAYTGSREVLDGRVETLHPKIHSGLLCRRDHPHDIQQAIQSHIELIDLLVVNFNPFEKIIQQKNCTVEKAMEAIDSGNLAMIRSAAKNFESVTVITDPADYLRVLWALENNTLASLRKQLGLKAFQKTAQYDYAIAEYLKAEQDEPDLDAIAGLPKQFILSLPLEKKLDYGENRHQHAALYGSFFSAFEMIHGPELDYHHIIDISSATYLLGEFEKSTVAIFKHTSPCSVSSNEDMHTALNFSLKTDPHSVMSSTLMLNRTLDQSLTQKIYNLSCEVIVAPEFTPEALHILSSKKHLRLLRLKKTFGAETLQEIRSVIGGILVQDRDSKIIDPTKIQVVTDRQPTPEEWTSLLFGWRVAKHAQSNAAIFSKEEHTLSIGSSLTTYLDSISFAIWKSRQISLSLANSTLALDGALASSQPLEIAANAGATAIIQSGGIETDAEVIAVANKFNMAMVFTGLSHFKH